MRAIPQCFGQFLDLALLLGLGCCALLTAQGLLGLLHLTNRPRQVPLSQLLGGLGGRRLSLGGRFRRRWTAGFLRRFLQRIGKRFLPGLEFLKRSGVWFQLGKCL